MWTKTLAVAGLAILALAIALPALAAEPTVTPFSADEVEQVIDLGTYRVATGELIPPGEPSADKQSAVDLPVWATTVPSGFFFSVPNTSLERSNIGDLAEDTIIGSFEIGFATDSAAPVGLSVAFYQSDDLFPPTLTPLQTLAGGDAIYDVTVGGLLGPPGFIGYTVTVDLTDGNEFVISGPDSEPDGLSDFAWGTVYTNPGDASVTCGGGADPCIGPLLSGPSTDPGATGSMDLWYQFDPSAWQGGAYGGAFFFGGFPPATFYLELNRVVGFAGVDIPTLSTVGLVLLALVLGLFALSRLRRRAATPA